MPWVDVDYLCDAIEEMEARIRTLRNQVCERWARDRYPLPEATQAYLDDLWEVVAGALAAAEKERWPGSAAHGERLIALLRDTKPVHLKSPALENELTVMQLDLEISLSRERDNNDPDSPTHRGEDPSP